MAVLYNGDSYQASDETLGYMQHFSGGNLLDEYRIHHRHTFGSLFDFKRICEDFYTAMKVGGGQYLGFSNVKRSDMEAIDEIRKDVPKMTILYDSEEEILILKFMAGVEHELCAGLFDKFFMRLVDTRTDDNFSLAPLKSSRCKGSHRDKEADNSYKPFTRIMKSDRPSVVFEIGVPESLAQLQLDAKHWIEDSQGMTRVVIIAFVDRVAKTILIERWQDAPGAALRQQQPARNVTNPNPYSRNPCVATLIQALSLQKGQIYNGPSLIIPADLVFDAMPAVPGVPLGPNDFEMSAEILNGINLAYWRLLI